jgi:hypothetical protein
VAIFGDLYSRDNDVMNQNLIGTIERHGGEVITTPYTDYTKIIAKAYFKKWLREGEYLEVMISKPMLAGMRIAERRYLHQFERVLGPLPDPKELPVEEILGRLGVRMENTGESFDNLLKVFYLLEHHPDISLFVQVNPAFCCPSLVTEAMGAAIERETGVPVVCITYDGTLSPKNDIVIPYLKLRSGQSSRAKTEQAG